MSDLRGPGQAAEQTASRRTVPRMNASSSNGETSNGETSNGGAANGGATNDARSWTDEPERGSEWLLRLMYRIAMLAGRPFARLLLVPIAGYFWMVTPRARGHSRQYLRRVLGRAPTLFESYRHYLTFSTTILDRFYFLSGRAHRYDIRAFGEERMIARLREGRGAFLVGAHMGSFEALRSLGRSQPDLRVGMAMFEENARKIRKLLTAIDPTLLDDVIPLGRMDSMIRIQDRLERGDFVGFLADRSFGQDVTLDVEFLGTTAAIPSGVFRMAAIMKRPVIFMTGLYQGGNRYELHFDELADFSNADRGTRSQLVEQAAKAFAGRLEHYCRQSPMNWFNFFDFWARPERKRKPSEVAGG